MGIKYFVAGAILFIFSSMYLILMWLFYYHYPMLRIKKKQNSLTHIISEDNIIVQSRDAEYKCTWKLIKEINFTRKYIYIINRDNVFIILDRKDIQEKELDAFRIYIKNKNIKIKTN